MTRRTILHVAIILLVLLVALSAAHIGSEAIVPAPAGCHHEEVCR